MVSGSMHRSNSVIAMHLTSMKHDPCYFTRIGSSAMCHSAAELVAAAAASV